MPRTPQHNLAPESAPWGNWMTNGLQGLESSIGTNRTNSDATARGLTGTINGLIRTIKSVPITESYGSESAGFGSSTSYTTRTSLTIPAQEGRGVHIYASAQARMRAIPSGGTNVPQFRSRILINGVGSPEILGYQTEQGSGGNGFVIVSSLAFTQSLGWTAGITVQFQTRNNYGSSEFPSDSGNFAQLSVLAIHSE